MARNAGRSLPIAGFHSLCVKAAVICRLLVRMTLGAGDLGGCVFVRRGFDIGVAVDTGKHATVNRSLKGLWIYRKANLLPIAFCRKGVVAVTGQAVVVGGL